VEFAPQPGFATQPGFPPQPGFAPQPGVAGPFPGAFPPPARKKSSALKIVLIVLAVMLVLCVGGAAAIFFAARDGVSEIAEAAEVKVVEPAELGGRPKLTGPQYTAGVATLSDAMSRVPGATSHIGAMYGNPAAKDIVMIAGAASIRGSEKTRLDQFVKGMTSGGFKTTDMAVVDAGPHGGIAQCGSSTVGGAPTAICVWSDEGSLGMITMLFKPVSDLEKEFIAMRGQIEQK
jgi:hypothetical protein